MVVGSILETRITKAHEYSPSGNGPEKKDAAGNPVPQLVIVVQATPDNYATATKPLVDETGQQLPDDGRRALYVEKGQNISFAIARALQAHDLDDVQIGGKIWVKWESNGKNPSTGYEFRQYEAGYQPAPQTSGFGFGDQQAAPVQGQTYQPQPPAQPAPPVQQGQPVAAQYAPPQQPAFSAPSQAQPPAQFAPQQDAPQVPPAQPTYQQQVQQAGPQYVPPAQPAAAPPADNVPPF